MKWYIAALKKYAIFDGRAGRREYWMFVLFNIVFTCVAMALDNLLGLTIGGNYYGVLYFLYCAAVFLPSLGATIRRLHDVGKSGAYIFVSLIPIAGAIWYLVLACREGDSGENAYGPSPQAE